MGFDKNRRSEEKPENPEKAETVPIEDKSITDTTPERGRILRAFPLIGDEVLKRIRYK